jgi:hypothetical protein
MIERAFLTLISQRSRQWDVVTTAHGDYIVASSHNAAERLSKRYWQGAAKTLCANATNKKLEN